MLYGLASAPVHVPTFEDELQRRTSFIRWLTPFQ
jgi:hypothetical protein